MAGRVILSFPGPLNGDNWSLRVENESGGPLRELAICGLSARYPIYFEEIGTPGPGVTETFNSGGNIIISWHFEGFSAGEESTLHGFQNANYWSPQISARPTVGDFVGSKALAVVEESGSDVVLIGEFAVSDDGDVVGHLIE